MSTMTDTQGRRTRRSFTDDYKTRAVRLLLDEGKTVASAARDPPASSWPGRPSRHPQTDRRSACERCRWQRAPDLSPWPSRSRWRRWTERASSFPRSRMPAKICSLLNHPLSWSPPTWCPRRSCRLAAADVQSRSHSRISCKMPFTHAFYPLCRPYDPAAAGSYGRPVGGETAAAPATRADSGRNGSLIPIQTDH